MITLIQRIPLEVLVILAALAAAVWELFKIVFPPILAKRLAA